jgi:heavy metal sensor kinase
MLSRLPIRFRLTLTFAAVMAVVLVSVGVFVYVRVSDSLDNTVNQDLGARADDVSALVRHPHAAGGDRGDLGHDSPGQLLAADGRVLRGSPSTPLLSLAQLRQAQDGRLVVQLRSIPGFDEGSWRLLARPIEDSVPPTVAVVAVSLEPREEALHHLLVQLLIGGPAALLLASLAAYALATAALRPVDAMSRKAAAISLKGDDQRLPVPCTRDEIAKLGERLNEMLTRIETALAHERRFLADASHELRTPLTILTGELEIALRRSRSRSELEQVVRTAKEESDRLAQLAEDLLVVARADQGGLPVHPEPTPLQPLLERVAARFETRAHDQGRRVVTRAPMELEALRDPVRVEQALANLIDNALRHGDGTVEISAQQQNGSVELHVTDDGSGFPPSFLPHAFERFSRPDQARTSGGSGLGLAIVEAVAHAHGGTSGVSNRAGGGSDVWLALPGARQPGTGPQQPDEPERLRSDRPQRPRRALT